MKKEKEETQEQAEQGRVRQKERQKKYGPKSKKALNTDCS